MKKGANTIFYQSIPFFCEGFPYFRLQLPQRLKLYLKNITLITKVSLFLISSVCLMMKIMNKYARKYHLISELQFFSRHSPLSDCSCLKVKHSSPKHYNCEPNKPFFKCTPPLEANSPLFIHDKHIWKSQKIVDDC